MKRKFLAFFVFASVLAHAQISSVVHDRSTGKPVPYVNVYLDDENWVSADENGVFTIDAKPSDTLLFTAVGYSPMQLNVGSSTAISIIPTTYALDNLMISKPKRTIEKTAGGYSRKALDNYYTTGGTPELMARYFGPDNSLKQTPFFKTLVVNTKSPVRNAKFIVHFLEANVDGTPGREMADANIIGIAKKGVENTQIDLTPYRLQLPDNGFFVAVEWLIIPENRYIASSFTTKDGILQERVQYAPYFGTVRSEANTSWGNRNGAAWRRFQKVSPERIQKYYDDFKKATGDDAPPFDERHVEFAMKLTMTN